MADQDKSAELVQETKRAEVDQGEEDYEPIIDGKQEIRNMYDNYWDRLTYENAKATDQISCTWEEWIFGKESKNEQKE